MKDKSVVVGKLYKTDWRGYKSISTPVFFLLEGLFVIAGIAFYIVEESPAILLFAVISVILSIPIPFSGCFSPLLVETGGVRMQRRFVAWEDLVLEIASSTFPLGADVYWLALSEGRLKPKTAHRQIIFQVLVTKENLELLFRFYNKKVEFLDAKIIDLSYRPTNYLEFKKRDPDGLIAKHNAKVDAMAMEKRNKISTSE